MTKYVCTTGYGKTKKTKKYKKSKKSKKGKKKGKKGKKKSRSLNYGLESYAELE